MTATAESLELAGLYETLEAVGTACDTSPSAEALAAEVGSPEAVGALVALGYVDPHACSSAGLRLLQVTEAGWAVLAQGGYQPPWDRALTEYDDDPRSFGEGASL